MCCRPRAGRVEEEVRQARAVELIAQKRLLDLHMRSQVCARCCSMPCVAGEHARVKRRKRKEKTTPLGVNLMRIQV
jgi:hypothetical protein